MNPERRHDAGRHTGYDHFFGCVYGAVESMASPLIGSSYSCNCIFLFFSLVSPNFITSFSFGFSVLLSDSSFLVFLSLSLYLLV